MLANAVSSAVDRLYATAPVGEDRLPVQRIGAVTRVREVSDNPDKPDKAVTADNREQSTQRNALTQGVRALFQASSLGDAGDNAGVEAASPEREAATKPEPDPQLEEAILRFIHTVFKSLAEAEGVEASGEAVATDAGARGALRATGASSGRSALGVRIDALAQRYADNSTGDATGSSSAVASSGTAPSTAEGVREPGSALSAAFDDVLKVMQGRSAAAETARGNRADLADFMHRLAQAMQGAPPVDAGLPTRGGLITTRA